jgi:hypothetical protein
VAFAWQNLDRYREEILSTAPSQVSCEEIALRVVAEATRRFVLGEPPAQAAELAAELRLSARAVNAAMGDLVELGLLLEVGDDQHVILNRDPRLLSPADVLHALRNAGEQVAARTDDALMERLRTLYEQAVDAADAVWQRSSFAEIAGDPAAGDERPAPRRESGSAARRATR